MEETPLYLRQYQGKTHARFHNTTAESFCTFQEQVQSTSSCLKSSLADLSQVFFPLYPQGQLLHHVSVLRTSLHHASREAFPLQANATAPIVERQEVNRENIW